jgi:hypothetical protein
MKEPLAAEHPTHDEIEQNAVNRKERISCFAARDVTQRCGELYFLKVFQKDFDASEAGGILQGKFSLDFADGCGRLHLKGAPLFG